MSMTDIAVFGPFHITPYSLAAAAAVIAALCLFYFSGKKIGLNDRILDKTALLVLPLGVFMGHFLYVAVKIKGFIREEGILFLVTPWRGGFMFFGVLLGVVLAVFIVCRDRREIKQLLGCLAPAMLLLIALFRFLEPLCGQGYGEDTEIMFFPLSYAIDPDWPKFRSAAIFFWAGLYGLCCCGVVTYYLLKHPSSFQAAKLGLILYCAGEILLESLRRDQVIKWSFVRVSQLISAVILALFVLYAVFKKRYTPKQAVLAILAMAALIGACVALEFSVDKPLILGSIYYYFTDWQTYSLLGLCGLLMGLLAWFATDKAERKALK